MRRKTLLIAGCIMAALFACAKPPLTPTAPWTDIVDDSLFFLVASTDPGGLGLEYTFDWGDGQTSTTRRYSSGETAYVRRSFEDPGWRDIRVRARNENGKSSAWSPSLRFRKSKPPVVSDDSIGGMVRWAVNRWYHASVRVTDPDGDSVAVKFIWGDIGNGNWTAPAPSGSVITDSCLWSVIGPHTIAVVARDQGGMVARLDVEKNVNVSQMAVVWLTSEDLIYEGTPTLGQIDGEPVIYCVEFDGALDCYALSGQQRWSSPLPGTTGYAASLSADGSRLYVTTDPDTGIVCLDSRTGRRLWGLDECTDACCTPALGPGGTIYVVTTPPWDADYLHRVRDFGDSAKVEWSLFLGVASPVDKGAAVGRNGTVYAVGYDDQQQCSFLVAVDSNGTVLWKDSARIQIGGTPVIDSQDRILVADLNGGLYCYNPDGTLAWSTATEGLCPMSTAVGTDDQVIVTTDELTIIRNYDSHGNERWASSSELDLQGWNTPCIAEDSTVIAFDGSSGYLYGIDDAGLTLWEFSIYDSLCGDRRRALRPEADFGSPLIGPNGDLYLTIEDGLVCIAHGGLKLANTAWPTYNHDNAHSGWAGRQ